jgi:DNA polymerase (family 10)
LDLVRLPGVGPKRARKLWSALGVTTVETLEHAAREGHVAELDGFGAKTQQRILDGITKLKERGNRLRLVDADEQVAPLLAHLEAHPGIRRVTAAGSLRRRLETIGDIDILAVTDAPAVAMAHFTAYPRVAKVELAGDTRGTVLLDSGLQVDLRLVPDESFGAALQYFTGSKAHNVKLRKRAVARGLSISEYGVVESDRDGHGGRDGQDGRDGQGGKAGTAGTAGSAGSAGSAYSFRTQPSKSCTIRLPNDAHSSECVT